MCQKNLGNIMCYEYHKEFNIISVFANQLIALQSGTIVAFPLIFQCLDSFLMLLFLRGDLWTNKNIVMEPKVFADGKTSAVLVCTLPRKIP